MAGFIFGAGTPYKSHEDLKRQRAVADRLSEIVMSNQGASSLPEGLMDFGTGIMAGLMRRRADKTEARGRADFNSRFNSVTSSLLGGGRKAAASPASMSASVSPTSVATPKAGKAAMGLIEYANQSAIRNDPLSAELTAALNSVLPELGVTAKVFSGGQEPTGPSRTGSTRHDHGNAADVFFYKDGRRLDWRNPDDLPIFQEIVRRGKAAGLTGFGAGEGYMQPGSMHIGFGNPGVWGAGGRGVNAPGWLRAAFNDGGASPAMASAPLQPTGSINRENVLRPMPFRPTGSINRENVLRPMPNQMGANINPKDLARPMPGGMNYEAMPQMMQNARFSTPQDFAAAQDGLRGVQAGGMQIMPVSAPAEPQIMPVSAPAMGRPATAFQGAEVARLENEVGVPRQQMEARRQAIMGQQGGVAPSGGGFFTNMVPQGAPPEQVAQVQQAEMALEVMPIEQIAELASSPFAEPWQQNLMQRYLEHRMEQQFAPPPDPMDQRKKELEIAKLEQGLKPPAPSPTDDMREYQYAITQGYKGTFADWQTQNRKAGAPNSTQIGTIPPGYQVEYDADGRPIRMVPLPGSPAEVDANKAATAAASRDSKKDTSTDVITGAAERARGLVGYQSTGLIGQALGPIGITDAAEVRRQVEVLKSIGSIESLTAMRRESPTGGALGAITDKENAMLAAAVGALDPSAGPESFRKALDDYELTLLRIVHGYGAGTAKFEELRQMREGFAAPAPQQGAYDLDIDRIPESTPVEGEDGQVYMKRNGKLWRQGASGWEAVQ